MSYVAQDHEQVHLYHLDKVHCVIWHRVGWFERDSTKKNMGYVHLSYEPDIKNQYRVYDTEGDSFSYTVWYRSACYPTAVRTIVGELTAKHAELVVKMETLQHLIEKVMEKN